LNPSKLTRRIKLAEYTKVNMKEDVDDQAPNFGLAPNLEARMARVPLELEGFGVSYQRIAPNFRVPFAHRHKQQEEVYVVVSGGGRAKLEGEVVDLKPWDALRVPKDTMRGFEAGPEGMEVIAIGAPNTGPGDAETANDWWSD
jgi:mannose-6-phosphate isomerase-like protein (cupin superfamily)